MGESAALRKMAAGREVLSVHGIALLELLEDTDFDPACVSVFGYRSDDLDSHSLVGLCIDGLDNLAKGSLAEETHCAIYREKNKDKLEGGNGWTDSDGKSCRLGR